MTRRKQRRKRLRRKKKITQQSNGITIRRIGSGLVHVQRHRRRVHKLRRGRTS